MAEIRIQEQATEELNEALAADAVDVKNYHIQETLSLFSQRGEIIVS